MGNFFGQFEVRARIYGDLIKRARQLLIRLSCLAIGSLKHRRVLLLTSYGRRRIVGKSLRFFVKFGYITILLI